MDSGSETEEPGIPRTSVDPLQEAEAVLGALAGIFYPSDSGREPNLIAVAGTTLPELEVRHKTLLEQIPAVVFMAPLEAGLSSAYVSPHIEAVLGFTQEQWLNDPVR
jgi:hypothetical protein